MCIILNLLFLNFIFEIFLYVFFFFFSSRRRHTRLQGDWSSDVCSSDLPIMNILTSASLSLCLKFMARVMEPITTGLLSGEQQINHVTIFLKLQHGLLVSTNFCVMTEMVTGIYLQLVTPPRL